jgi:predicted Zn finger-like uncharacterized protein
MIVQCPQCDTKYRLDEKQLASQQEVMVRCKKCGSGFSVHPSEALFLEPEASIPEPGFSGHDEPKLPADKKVSVLVTEGPLKGKAFPIDKPRVVLGRAGADIVVPDTEVSRKHCLLEVHGPTATLKDLGSTNGTYVDGQRVETRELEHMTEFRIGGSVLIFTVSARHD